LADIHVDGLADLAAPDFFCDPAPLPLPLSTMPMMTGFGALDAHWPPVGGGGSGDMGWGVGDAGGPGGGRKRGGAAEGVWGDDDDDEDDGYDIDDF